MTRTRVLAAFAAAALVTLPAASRAAEPTTLKFVFPAPLSPFSKAMFAWKDNVEKDTKGAVQVKMFVGTAVANFGNVLDRIQNGVVDLGFGIYGPYSRQVPKTFVVELPFESDTSVEGSVGLWRLKEEGVTANEYKAYRPLALFCFTGTSLHSTRPVTGADDIKGLKVAASGKVMADDLSLMGAAPVTINPTEFYESLNRNLAQGVLISWDGALTFKLQDVSHYHMSVPFGQFPAFVIMNTKSYERLPADGRAAVDKYSGEIFSRQIAEQLDATNVEAIAKFKEMKGQHVAALTPDQLAKWKTTLAPITADWVKHTPDGAHVLAAFRAAVEKIRAGH